MTGKILEGLSGRLAMVIMIAVLVYLLPVESAAEMPENQPSSEQETRSFDRARVENRMAEIKEELAFAEKKGERHMAGLSPSELQEYYSNLRELEAVYQRQITTSEAGESLKKEEESMGRELQSKQEIFFAEPPPYNLSEYDLLLDQLATVEKEEETLLSKFNSDKKTLEEDKTKLEIARKKVRDISEELQQSDKSDKAPSSLMLSWELGCAEIEEEKAQAFVDFKKMSIENVETGQKLAGLKKEIIQRQANWVGSKLTFDPYDLRKKLSALEERRVLLQFRIDKLKGEQTEIEKSWVKAQEEFEKAQGAGEAAREKAKTHLEAREAWMKTYRQVLEQTENMLILLGQEKLLWQNRYALLEKKFNFEELDKLQVEAKGNTKNIDRLVSFNEKYQSELQAEIAASQKILEEASVDPVIKENVETRVNALQKMAERIFEYLTLLQSARRTELRFINEIGLIRNDVALQERFHEVGSKIEALWNFELWVVDDRSVTVKKVAVALFILIVGMLLTRWVTRTLIRRILVRTRLDDSGTAAVEKMFYSIVLVVLVFFSLRSVNIPITVFTFLGGAIAIGVGFGAQSLLNNFISGFILLIERPVKINDMIEVGDNFGIIEKIGMRCTRVRTPGNVHILVPNSTFLEKNIVNWTLSDQKIRAEVSVGVAHGLPTDVSRLMIQAVDEHEKVLKDPAPVTLFDAVGESSLTFIVYFWISIKSLYLLERRIIESDVRFRLIELFDQAGIVVAHPQRDVHLDNAKPLELRLVKSGPDEIA